MIWDLSYLNPIYSIIIYYINIYYKPIGNIFNRFLIYNNTYTKYSNPKTFS